MKILFLFVLSFLFNNAVAQTAASSAASAAVQTAEQPSTAHDLKTLDLRIAQIAASLAANAITQTAEQPATAHDLKTLELQFQEKMLDLRKETLDSQQETIAWWLAVIALLGVILPTVFYFRARSEIKDYAQQSKDYLDKIKEQLQISTDYAEKIKKMSGYQSEPNPDNAAEQQAAVQAAKELQDNRDIPFAEQLRARAILLSDKAQSYAEYKQAFYAWQAVILYSPNDADAILQAAYYAQQAYEHGNREQRLAWLPDIESGYKLTLKLKPNNFYYAANNLISLSIHEYRALLLNNPTAAQAKLTEAQTLAEDFLRNYPQYVPELAYNRACLFALLGDSEEKVVKQLKLSASASNFPSKQHIEQEKDFDTIRDSEAFQTWFRQQFPD